MKLHNTKCKKDLTISNFNPLKKLNELGLGQLTVGAAAPFAGFAYWNMVLSPSDFGSPVLVLPPAVCIGLVVGCGIGKAIEYSLLGKPNDLRMIQGIGLSTLLLTLHYTAENATFGEKTIYEYLQSVLPGNEEVLETSDIPSQTARAELAALGIELP